MHRILLVGVLILGLFVNGCAGRRYVERPTDPPVESANWDPPPRKEKHPVLDWCREHPVTTGAATAVLVVVGIFGAGALMIAHGFAPMSN